MERQGLELTECFLGVVDLNWQPADYIQLLTSLFTFLAVVVSIATFSKQINRQRKVSAVDIGLKVEELVVKWAYIDFVLMESNPEIYRFLSEKAPCNMKRFESDEIKSVYSQEELELIRTFFIADEYNSNYNGGPALVFNVSPSVVKKANLRFPTIATDIINEDSSDLVLTFQKVLIKTLNQMETLCMMMVEGVADESIAYKMINSPFCHYVKVLYYYIASTNNSTFLKDNLVNSKKMKHVIMIFNKWEKRRKRNVSKSIIKSAISDFFQF